HLRTTPLSNSIAALHTTRLVSSAARLHLTSPLVPYTTLFRSKPAQVLGKEIVARAKRIPSMFRRSLTPDTDKATHGAIANPDGTDRKSTRLNSSHEWRSYAVFCLKKNTAEIQTSSCHTIYPV